MKQLQDYQMRVVDELEELSKKTRALFKFLLDDEKTVNLPKEEMDMLISQHTVMSEYENILIKRVEYFVKNSPERDS